MIEAIARHQLRARSRRRLRASHDAELVIGDGVLDLVRPAAPSSNSGGRMIDAILTNTLLPSSAAASSTARSTGPRSAKVTVTVEDGAFAYDFA